MAESEKNCRWYFPDQPNGNETGPNNPLDQSFKQHPYASLVRESIQNSLDAVYDKAEPVLVCFDFKEMDGQMYPELFRLKEHIEGCLLYFPNNKNAKDIYKPMLKLFDESKGHIGYICVSDYNTKGMDYKEDDTDCPFYAFVRSAGVSSKEGETAGGSYGFGKAAYFLLSPISTIIVSTCTEKYDRFFEGVSSLCTHTYHGAKKMSVGYYDDRSGKPISDETSIPVRFRRSEPGTDINILGFDISEKTEAIEEMKEAVIENFWLAIYSGRLKVRLDGQEISKENIVDIIESKYPDIRDDAKSFRHYNVRPYYEAVSKAGLNDKFVLCQDTLPLLGHVFFYVRKDKNATDKILFMRSPLMLVYGRKNKTNYGFAGVFICDSPKGNEMLRAMENSAHTEWKAANWKVNRKASTEGKMALMEMDDFIVECLGKIFSLKDQSIIDIKDLEEFLYIPTDYEENEDLEQESLVGQTTGLFKDDGASITTEILDSEDNPTIPKPVKQPVTGHVMISKPGTAKSSDYGKLRSGHGSNNRTPKPGIQKPGDNQDVRTEDPEGEKGIYSSPLDISYRSFSQITERKVWHYIILHSDVAISNVRIHFSASGEEDDEDLIVIESDTGCVSGKFIRDVVLVEGRNLLKVRFADNLKHSIKIAAEEYYEI